MAVLILVMTLAQQKLMADCLKIISPAPKPYTKIDKCEILLGFSRSGKYRSCYKVAGGSCEVQ